MQTDMKKQESTEKRKPAKAKQRNEETVSVPLGRDSIQAMGCRTKSGASAILEPAINAYASLSSDVPSKAEDADSYLSLIDELKPRDPFESLLISQMIMVHKQAMHVFYLSNLDGNRGRVDIQDSLTNRYIKLMRLYNQQLEALDKHRRGGKQTVSVEHVDVHEGGQALVGNVGGGGVKDEK